MRGTYSIVTYALQRKELVEERLCVRLNFDNQIMLLKHLILSHNTFFLNNQKEMMTTNREQIKALMNHIKSFLSVEAPYLGMLHDYIRKVKCAGGFDDLIKFEIDLEDIIT